MQEETQTDSYLQIPEITQSAQGGAMTSNLHNISGSLYLDQTEEAS